MAEQSSSSSRLKHLYLMSGLLAGWDWFDKGLQNSLAARGLPTLNKTQSMMMMYISAGVHRPIDIARQMGLSRQAIRHIAQQLEELGLIGINQHSKDKRGRFIDFKGSSLRSREAAEEIIDELENELCSRIGARNVDTLRKLLRSDWGPVVPGTDPSSKDSSAKGR